jgi:antitoxin component of MazEF toxin-antitoxin module
MKNALFTIIAMLLFGYPAYAQFTSVTYDTDKQWFNEGQALPAEEALVVKGVLPQGVERIEIQILSSKSDLLYSSVGKRLPNNEFAIPLSYKLRSSDKYDFRIAFFQKLSANEKNALTEKINTTLDTYIEVNLSGDKSIELLKKSGKTVKEMNALVADMLDRYRNQIADWNPEFSEVVRLKLEQMDKADLSKNYVKGDTTTNVQTVRSNTRARLINEMKEQVRREVGQMLNMEMLVLSETQLVDNYPTESKENGLSINVGYGGVYLSSDQDNFVYGASPYVGLAFPLGNSVLGSKFLGNTSLTLGFFWENFEDENGNEVTGFLVNRPVYLGLDHKLFKFIRINAGATFLEGVQVPTMPNMNEGRNVLVRPYLGLSARIDLSIGLGK